MTEEEKNKKVESESLEKKVPEKKDLLKDKEKKRARVYKKII